MHCACLECVGVEYPIEYLLSFQERGTSSVLIIDEESAPPSMTQG